MRFWFSGPPILGIRTGISLSKEDFKGARQKPAGNAIAFTLAISQHAQRGYHDDSARIRIKNPEYRCDADHKLPGGGELGNFVKAATFYVCGNN
jgi:hypothetical protein